MRCQNLWRLIEVSIVQCEVKTQVQKIPLESTRQFETKIQRINNIEEKSTQEQLIFLE